MNLCIWMICVLAGGVLPAQPGEDVGQKMADARSDWFADNQQDVERQGELLTAAYELNNDLQAKLRGELERRLAEQYDYEESLKAGYYADFQKRAEAVDLSKEGTAEVQAVVDELLSIYTRMPMNPDTLATWVEGHVPPERVAQGRARFEELNRRHEQRRDAHDADLERRAGRKKAEALGRLERQASLSASAKPMPRDRKEVVEAERRVEQVAEEARTVRPSSQTKLHPGAPKVPPKVDLSKPQRGAEAKPATAPKQVPAAPAPPLDEWDRQVIQVAEKYEFSESQITMARAILRGLRGRAYQYRMSRAGEYAQAELLTDKKAREGRLKELDTAIDALFEELKQRLECLPTSKQKAKAKPRAKASK